EVHETPSETGRKEGGIPTPRPSDSLLEEEAAATSVNPAQPKRASDACRHQPLGFARRPRGLSHVRALATRKFLQIRTARVRHRCAGRLQGGTRRSPSFRAESGAQGGAEGAAPYARPPRQTAGRIRDGSARSIPLGP